ncbi:hypothetical protein [Segatella copri]|uniref:hypothetical protein n=1 Tax=Segatella copri TaxID=165179 RepID=UPI00294AEFA0|nr:hypothetical protein [Segatella copri]
MDKTTMTVSSQSFFAKKCALMAMTMTALTVNANPVDTGLGFAANGNSLAFCSFESNTQMQQDNIYLFPKKKNLRERYKRISQSNWFNSTYNGKTLGEILTIEE